MSVILDHYLNWIFEQCLPLFKWKIKSWELLALFLHTLAADLVAPWHLRGTCLKYVLLNGFLRHGLGVRKEHVSTIVCWKIQLCGLQTNGDKEKLFWWLLALLCFLKRWEGASGFPSPLTSANLLLPWDREVKTSQRKVHCGCRLI